MTDEKKVLLKFVCNWADEMDIKGFEIVSKPWWEKYKEKYPDEPFSSYVGSNQEVEFPDKESYFKCFTVFELTDEEAALLKKIFVYDSYGKVIWNEDFDMDEED